MPRCLAASVMVYFLPMPSLCHKKLVTRTSKTAGPLAPRVLWLRFPESSIRAIRRLKALATCHEAFFMSRRSFSKDHRPLKTLLDSGNDCLLALDDEGGLLKEPNIDRVQKQLGLDGQGYDSVLLG